MLDKLLKLGLIMPNTDLTARVNASCLQANAKLKAWISMTREVELTINSISALEKLIENSQSGWIENANKEKGLIIKYIRDIKADTLYQPTVSREMFTKQVLSIEGEINKDLQDALSYIRDNFNATDADLLQNKVTKLETESKALFDDFFKNQDFFFNQKERLEQFETDIEEKIKNRQQVIEIEQVLPTFTTLLKSKILAVRETDHYNYPKIQFEINFLKYCLVFAEKLAANIRDNKFYSIPNLHPFEVLNRATVLANKRLDQLLQDVGGVKLKNLVVQRQIELLVNLPAPVIPTRNLQVGKNFLVLGNAVGFGLWGAAAGASLFAGTTPVGMLVGAAVGFAIGAAVGVAYTYMAMAIPKIVNFIRTTEEHKNAALEHARKREDLENIDEKQQENKSELQKTEEELFEIEHLELKASTNYLLSSSPDDPNINNVYINLAEVIAKYVAKKAQVLVLKSSGLSSSHVGGDELVPAITLALSKIYSSEEISLFLEKYEQFSQHIASQSGGNGNEKNSHVATFQVALTPLAPKQFNPTEAKSVAAKIKQQDFPLTDQELADTMNTLLFHYVNVQHVRIHKRRLVNEICDTLISDYINGKKQSEPVYIFLDKIQHKLWDCEVNSFKDTCAEILSEIDAEKAQGTQKYSVEDVSFMDSLRAKINKGLPQAKAEDLAVFMQRMDLEPEVFNQIHGRISRLKNAQSSLEFPDLFLEALKINGRLPIHEQADVGLSCAATASRDSSSTSSEASDFDTEVDIYTDDTLPVTNIQAASHRLFYAISKVCRAESPERSCENNIIPQITV